MKRRFDDKATWRTDVWGIDVTQPARSERIFDPNDAVTDDTSLDPGAIGGGGSNDTHKITKMVAVLRTDQYSDPSQAVGKAYQ